MQIIRINPSGFCKGVVNAIEIAKQTRIKYPNIPIYILGMLVHNKNVVNDLTSLNITTIHEPNKTRSALLETIDEGIVIATAHGISPNVRNQIVDKGLTLIDATCSDVLKIQNLIINKLKDNYHILYIGKKNHPESEAVLEIDYEKITLIENIDDLLNFKKNKVINNKIFMTNQTTLSLYDIYQIYETAKKEFKNIEIENEICIATKLRQEAIMNMNPNIDCVLIVGDKASHNSNKLVSIASQKCDAYLIESIEDINLTWFENKKYIGVGAGASTPIHLTNQVINYLKEIKN